MKNLSKSPAVLLAKRCDELFHDDMKNNGDPFKNFYKSLPICILDAVFSIGVRYKSVTNTVNSYIDTFGLPKTCEVESSDEHTINSFLDNIGKYETIEAFAKDALHNMQRTSSQNGILKAEACRDVALVCKNHGINTLKDFREYADKKSLDCDIRAVKGQSSGIMLKYLYMLAGDESIVKPDRHVIRFIQENSDSPVKSQEEIQLVMEQATSILRNTYPKLTVRYLDNLIWDYQRHKKNS